MSNALEIERAVEKLPPEELALFRAWFAKFDAECWDRRFERDVADGRLDSLADEAITEVREGRSTKR